jgi:hypothetical protein
MWYRDECFLNVAEDRPLIAQFCGNDPDLVSKAAQLVLEHCEIDGVDLNLGCPQGIAKKGIENVLSFACLVFHLLNNNNVYNLNIILNCRLMILIHISISYIFILCISIQFKFLLILSYLVFLFLFIFTCT